MGTKNDMNRIGLFQEMAYISINDPYVPSTKSNLNWRFICFYFELNNFKCIKKNAFNV